MQGDYVVISINLIKFTLHSCSEPRAVGSDECHALGHHENLAIKDHGKASIHTFTKILEITKIEANKLNIKTMALGGEIIVII